ncbi:MAG: extensin family protein [Pseudomonadota bacterium]
MKKTAKYVTAINLFAAMVFVSSPLSAQTDPIKAAIVTDTIVQDAATDKNAERPQKRPKTLGQILGLSKKPKTAAKLCKNKEIIGEVVAPISKGNCGIAEPVRVTEIAGIRLINGATINCTTANAVHEWLSKSAKKELKRKQGGLVAVKVAASYACRTRNHKKGARLSEHSFGNAIDISEFHLAKGGVLTVLKDWRGSNSKVMRQMHRDACDSFGTVLGPQADKYHQNHFHLDVAKRRSGSYCR